MEDQKTQSLAIPIAIILGFALIAAAIFFGGRTGTGTTATPQQGTQGTAADTLDTTTGTINPVTETDHIRGNPNAPILLVEYSDYDCPFCKNFHETMQRVMQEYGTDGQVAWVYRHFPLEQLHPNAPRIAQASECVAELGGNEAFWTFSDLVFGERGINEQTNVVRLADFAAEAGVSEADLTSCLESGRTQEAVTEDFENAIAIGGRGTPHTIVLVGDQQGVVNGAQPYEVVKQIIDNLVAQIEGE